MVSDNHSEQEITIFDHDSDLRNTMVIRYFMLSVLNIFLFNIFDMIYSSNTIILNKRPKHLTMPTI